MAVPCASLASSTSAADRTTVALPDARPLTDRRFESTPARLEHGRYLAEHLLQCFICHSERDWSRPGAPPVEGREGIGHDGRALSPAMWYRSFARLSDEELASVVVFLRTIPAVLNVLPPTRLRAIRWRPAVT